MSTRARRSVRSWASRWAGSCGSRGLPRSRRFRTCSSPTCTGSCRRRARSRGDLPWSMLTAIVLVAVIYESIQAVCVGTVPGLAHSERPLAEAGARVLGHAGALIVSLGALVSILGTLNGVVLVAPRLLFAMAERGELPRI